MGIDSEKATLCRFVIPQSHLQGFNHEKLMKTFSLQQDLTNKTSFKRKDSRDTPLFLFLLIWINYRYLKFIIR
jgi:hypothetical protein